VMFHLSEKAGQRHSSLSGLGLPRALRQPGHDEEDPTHADPD